MAFESSFRRTQVVHRSIFAFNYDLQFPNTVFDGVFRHYNAFEDMTLDSRIQFTTDSERWSLPWIDNIAILNCGVINWALWHINNKKVASYAAYSTIPNKDGIDAYGFLERSLLMDLILGYRKHDARDELPGLAPAMFANSAQLVEKDSFIILPDEDVTQVGTLAEVENAQWVARVYHPKVTN